jgi:hypothetical protein
MTNKEGTLTTLGPISNRDALLGLKPTLVWASLLDPTLSVKASPIPSLHAPVIPVCLLGKLG